MDKRITHPNSVRYYRQQSHIRSGNELARRAGVSPSAISYIERGIYPFSSEILARISAALGVPIDDLKSPTFFNAASAAATGRQKRSAPASISDQILSD